MCSTAARSWRTAPRGSSWRRSRWTPISSVTSAPATARRRRTGRPGATCATTPPERSPRSARSRTACAGGSTARGRAARSSRPAKSTSARSCAGKTRPSNRWMPCSPFSLRRLAVSGRGPWANGRCGRSRLPSGTRPMRCGRSVPSPRPIRPSTLMNCRAARAIRRWRTGRRTPTVTGRRSSRTSGSPPCSRPASASPPCASGTRSAASVAGTPLSARAPSRRNPLRASPSCSLGNRNPMAAPSRASRPPMIGASP